jgi:AcrR family transcriptional regulator
MPRILTPTAIQDFRESLCDAAVQLFSERGYEGFHMRELGKRFGVSTMTPYRYFKDKNEILDMIRARAFARLADQLEMAQADGGTPAEKMTALSRAYINFAKDEHTYYRLMFDLSQSGSQHAPAAHRQEARVRAILASHVHLPLPKNASAHECEIAGQLLWSALHGMAALRLCGHMNDTELDRIMSEALQTFISACATITEAASFALPSAAYVTDRVSAAKSSAHI